MSNLRTAPPPPPPPPSNPLDLDVTIVSAKHLKNVNWRNGGDLKPYAIFWVDPERRLATKPDESGSTKPVWNEQFTIPITVPIEESQLTIEIFHSKPSETPKPLVGTARFQLNDLLDSLDQYDYHVSGSTPRIHTLDIVRPSGRPQGKVKVKIGVRGRPLPPPPPQQPSGYPDYNFAPQSGSYYYGPGAPPPPPRRDYRDQYSSPAYAASPPPPPAASPYSYAPYHGYYSNYYSHPPPPAPQMQPPSRASHHYSAVSGPSAPVDSSGYDDRASSVAGVTGTLGGLGLDERVKFEEEKRGERGESEVAVVRESYNDYRGKY